MKKASFSLALLVALFLLLAIAAVRPIASQLRPANARPVPLERLSLEQRTKTSPDSTLVEFRIKTFTLGQLRAAHQMRTASLAKARATGTLTAQNLNSQSAKAGTPAGRVDVTQPQRPKPGTPGRINVTQPQPPTFQRPVVTNNGGLIHDLTAPQWVFEPASDYASAPADMKAFCAAALASACLYLPPQQEIVNYNGSALDVDALIDQSQCTSEGGSWVNSFDGPLCHFLYPQSVTVRFTPPSNFQVSSTAQCDQSVFTYQVDTHGAVAISIKQSGTFTTGSSPWCVVKVKLGN